MTGSRKKSVEILDVIAVDLDLDESLVKFCRLLAFIETPVVPKILFDRACRSRVIWTESGEPGSASPNQNKVPSWLIRFFNSSESSGDKPDALQPALQNAVLSIAQEDCLLEYYCLNEKWRNPLRAGVPLSNVSSYLFNILAIVLQAFPESQTEIVWEEVENQLWGVIETTVLPFIAVLHVEDLIAEISSEHIHTQICFVTAFLRFLSRVSDNLGDNAPPSVAKLHRDTFQFASNLVSVYSRSSSATLSGIQTSFSMKFYAPREFVDNKLEDHGSERLNAASAFFAAGATLEHLPRALQNTSSWFPISRGRPSTMEIIALGSVQGVSTVMELFRIFLHSLPLQFNVLLGFYAIKQQSFETALDILEPNLAGVAELYGATSMEHLVTGIELVKCHNFMLEEMKGENLARKLWSDVFGLEDGRIKVTSLYQTYLATVLSDCFIGQAKYDEAEAILLEILECPMASNDIIVSSTIRLLKMSRRQRKERPTFDVWDILEKAVICIDEVTDDLKYECVEEAMCHISVLDENPTQIPRAEIVVSILSRCSFEHYSGSNISKQNLKDHMLALQRYRKGFKLFSVSGPQLHFSRLIRDGFPSASISFIERIGTTNWNRFNRVKDLPLRANIVTDEAYHADGKSSVGPSDSIFTDSALGSSLQTASKARSRISYHSLGSIVAAGLDNFPLMPEGVPRGKPFECPICCKRLRGISTTAQWENHVYADLQPYTCIVDECSSRYITFGSRAEFTAHITEHQNVRIWKCRACSHIEDDDTSMKEHIANMHSGHDLASNVESCLVRRNIAEEECPFCGEIPGPRFIGHICRHLEEIALTVLPKEVEWDSGSDEENSASSTSTFTTPPVNYTGSTKFPLDREFTREVEAAKFDNTDTTETETFVGQYILDAVTDGASGPTRQLLRKLPCDECKKLRTKCNRQIPCSHCVEFGLSCQYAAEPVVAHKVSRKDIHPDIAINSGEKTYEYMFVSTVVGTILEHNAERIRDIEIATGCEIEISLFDPQEAERKIGFLGVGKAIKAAQMAIEEQIEQLTGTTSPKDRRLSTEADHQPYTNSAPRKTGGIQFGSLMENADPYPEQRTEPLKFNDLDPFPAGAQHALIFGGHGGDDSDFESGRPTIPSSSLKSQFPSGKEKLTREEQEAAYEKARKRIFGENDMEASAPPNEPPSWNHFLSTSFRAPEPSTLGGTEPPRIEDYSRSDGSVPGVDVRDATTNQYNKELINFINDGSRQEFTFPPAVHEQRRIIHTLAHHLGLNHYTLREGSNSFVRISRKAPKSAIGMHDLPNGQYWSQLKQFFNDTSRDELIFPPQGPEHRRIIHSFAQQLGLDHFTLGEGDNRYSRVTRKIDFAKLKKPEDKTGTEPAATFPIGHPDYKHPNYVTGMNQYNTASPGQAPTYTPTANDDTPPLGFSRLGSDGQASETHHPSYSSPYYSAHNQQGSYLPAQYSGGQLPSRLPSQPSQTKTGRARTTTGGWENPNEPQNWDELRQAQARAQTHLFETLASLQEEEKRLRRQLHEQNQAHAQFQTLPTVHPSLLETESSSHRASLPELIPPRKMTPSPPPTFTKPRKNAAIIIKKPDGTPLDIDAALQVPITSEDIKNAQRRAPWFCADCRIEFRSLKNYDKHRRYKHMAYKYGCTVDGCEMVFLKREHRNTHEVKDHGRLNAVS